MFDNILDIYLSVYVCVYFWHLDSLLVYFRQSCPAFLIQANTLGEPDKQ